MAVMVEQAEAGGGERFTTATSLGSIQQILQRMVIQDTGTEGQGLFI